MPSRSNLFRFFGLSLGALLIPSAAAAQQPAPVAPAPAPAAPPGPAASAPPPPSAEAPPSSARPLVPFRLDIDLYVGLTYRVGSVDSALNRGGGLVGLSVHAGPPKAIWSVGLGYERSFLGTERSNDPASDFRSVDRGLDALWVLGRAYPYETDDLSLYVTLGLAPIWQRVTASRIVLANETGVLRPTTANCSAGGSAGLGLRLAAGAQLAINQYVGFNVSLGADHLRTSDEVLDGCAAGLGAATALAARFGLVFTAGREKAYEPPPPALPSDRDGDRIIDLADACPDVPGVPSADAAKHGCPPPGDRDGDGITDDLDACPVEAGIPNQDPRKHGCPAPPPPPDQDGDKIADAQDACPDIAGVATADPATNGCPPDTDGDGIRDDKDACREQKGVPSDDPTKNGCPLVVFTETEIVIAQQVQFETDKAVIRPVSDGLLNEVANVIKQHPEVVKLEVQGHTDSSGKAAHNKQLSKSRAEAVRVALVKRGVNAKALQAQGYGSDQPIADNATDEGKARNRRVQFKILEKK